MANPERSFRCSSFALCLVALSLDWGASAQTVPPPATKCPASPAAENKGCQAPAAPAQQFPYPGEKNEVTTGPSSPVSPLPTSPTTAVQPSTPPTPPAGPAKQFPYPGEDPESGAASTGSSSSSASSAPDAADPNVPDAASSPLKDAGSEGQTTRRRLPKVERLQSDEDRESEDLDIAKYYLSAGNPMAAYLRSKDAVKLKPRDPDAHFLLAQSAEKLRKHDEAVSEFGAYLQMEPDGDHAKAAQRSLAVLH